jgi:hypothetical protein
MSETTYWIYNGQEPITDATNRVFTDLDEIKGIARALSERDPVATITVKSRIDEPGAKGWGPDVVATFVNGKPYPSQWKVGFVGELLDADFERLAAAGVEWREGGSGVGAGNVLRAGRAQHVVTLEADDGQAAVDAVREALGPRSTQIYEWTYDPSDFDDE